MICPQKIQTITPHRGPFFVTQNAHPETVAVLEGEVQVLGELRVIRLTAAAAEAPETGQSEDETQGPTTSLVNNMFFNVFNEF